jgi:hypothetical protein
MRTKTILLALIAAAPVACVHVMADVDAEENVGFQLDDFGTTCAGSGQTQTDTSLTTWTKTPVGDRCQVDVVWSGTLIDMKAVREKADEQAQGATLTIRSIDLGFDDVAFRDQAGTDITPPRVPAWEAHFTMGGEALADFSGTDVTSLLATPLSFDVPASGIALANQAFADAAPLIGAATARLVVEMTDLPALAAAVGPHVQFHFHAHVGADAKKDLL